MTWRRTRFDDTRQLVDWRILKEFFFLRVWIVRKKRLKIRNVPKQTRIKRARALFWSWHCEKEGTEQGDCDAGKKACCWQENVWNLEPACRVVFFRRRKTSWSSQIWQWSLIETLCCAHWSNLLMRSNEKFINRSFFTIFCRKCVVTSQKQQFIFAYANNYNRLANFLNRLRRHVEEVLIFNRLRMIS